MIDFSGDFDSQYKKILSSTHIFLEVINGDWNSSSWPSRFEVEVEVLVAQSYPALSNPVDCSPPGSSVCGILQARILEWVAIPSSRWSSRPRDQTQVSRVAGGLYHLSHQGSPTVYNNSLFVKYLRNYMPRTDLSTWNTVLGRGGCVYVLGRGHW